MNEHSDGADHLEDVKAVPPAFVLQEFLFSYVSTPDEKARSRIEEDAWQTFGMRGAVVVLDMAGFSRTSQEHGIVYYLAMIHRMRAIVGPIAKRYGGEVVKFEADNCFLRFPDVQRAIEAMIGIQMAVEAANRSTPKDLDIELSCGIDYGDFLLVGDQDCFGVPVNRASKLGEDLGDPGDILVSRDAKESLEDCARFRFERVQYFISGVSLEAYRILR
jgi:class 3 adenylate cyclase